MRVAAYLFFAVSFLFLADALRDELRGAASTRSPTRVKRAWTATRADDLAEFRRLTIYQWFRGSLVLGGGLVLLAIHRRVERSNPFAPDA